MVAPDLGFGRRALKSALKNNLGDRSYSLFHHESRGDLNLQIADYICWAIQRKWERRDERSYILIEGSIVGEGDLFMNGNEEYYEYPEN